MLEQISPQLLIKIDYILIAFLLIVGVIFVQHSYAVNQSSFHTNLYFEKQIMKILKTDKTDFLKLNAPNAVFKVYAKKGDFVLINDKKIFNFMYIERDPKINYDKISVEPNKKTIVVFPTFTASAYSKSGFYDYYGKKCDSKCLTVHIKNDIMIPQIAPVTIQVLKLLGYSFITDTDVDKNPSILKSYDKVILLHNEYVTKKEFYAITHHPHVIYLYANALYAEVKTNYQKNTITLVNGHGYPTKDSNGFNWKFDNSKFEYNYNCKDVSFKKIDNGWMLDCFPVLQLLTDENLLMSLRELN